MDGSESPAKNQAVDTAESGAAQITFRLFGVTISINPLSTDPSSLLNSGGSEENKNANEDAQKNTGDKSNPKTDDGADPVPMGKKRKTSC